MSCKSSFLIFDEFESNKENIDPLTGICSNVNPSFTNKLNKKRVPLRDITPVIKKTSKANEGSLKVTFVPPVFNLIVKPSSSSSSSSSTRNGAPIDSTLRSLR